MKEKDCSCLHYKLNEPHEYTCALNISQHIKEPNTMNQTPTPWKKARNTGVSIMIESEECAVIAEVNCVNPRVNGEANAAFIVTACNAHEDLVMALKALLSCVKMDSDMEEDFAKEIKQSKEALLKAGVKI